MRPTDRPAPAPSPAPAPTPGPAPRRPAVVIALVLRALRLALLPALLIAPAPASAHARTAGPVGGPLLAGRGVVADLPPGVAAPPRSAAAAYLVADADTGAVLAAKAPHRRLRPASALKALLALTVFDSLDPAAVYTARWEDANVEGSRVGIVPHATYRVHQLWQGLFLRSGNDAANALANAYGGVPRTVAAMNATARELQARETYAVNPSGLDEPRQYSSAYDLALIGRAALRSPGVMRYAGTVKAQFPGKMPPRNRARKTFQIQTQQKFLLKYDGAIGIKNGYTSLARYTLVAAATRGGRTLLVTVLRSPDNAWQDAAALADWGFANAARVRPVGGLVEPLSAEPPAGASPAPSAPAAAGGTDVAGSARDGGLPTGRLTLGLVLALVGSAAALRARVLVRRSRGRTSAARARRSGARRSGAQRSGPQQSGPQQTGTQQTGVRRPPARARIHAQDRATDPGAPPSGGARRAPRG